MKKIMFTLAFASILSVIAIPVQAQEANPAVPSSCKHEFRIGVGDNFTDLGFAAWSPNEGRNKYILPNLFVDYTYHFCHWFGLGLQINTIWWGGDTRERMEGAEWHSYLYGNVSLMPTLRFTYFHTPKNNVALYSSVYGGYCAGFDKKTDNTFDYIHGFSAGFTAVGVSFGGEHWFGAAELGAMFGFSSTTQLGSRLLSIATGYRF